MKISIIGAGNVGGLTALRIAQDGLGEVILVDVVKGLAAGKALDLEDAGQIIGYSYSVKGTEDIQQIKDSDIIIITAGLTRKPGMMREDLIDKNAQILKGICLKIKKLSAHSIVLVVTNPLDIMTYLGLKITGFSPAKLFGMGVSLDIARFANLISKELNISPEEVDACVIGSHGESMLPLTRFTTVKGITLEEFFNDQKIELLVKMTKERGQQIISLLGSGSAYFAPSAAIASIVKTMVKDEKRTLGVSAYLQGEYGISDICIGVPCRLGKEGIEKVIELDLNPEEKESFLKSAAAIKNQYNNITV